MDSILDSIKKLLGIEPEETHFDQELIMHINSALMNLNQLGVGEECVMISSDLNTWDSILGINTNLEAVKIYIYLKVRLVFDPPTSAFVLDSIERQITQLEWRLNVQVEKFIPEVVVNDE
jgi:hypothetical protein